MSPNSHSLVYSPLLDEVKLANCGSLLVNLTGRVTTADVDEVRVVLGDASPAEQKIGYCFEDSAGDELKVTIIAAGFDHAPPPAPRILTEPVKRFTPPELLGDDSFMKGGNPYEKVHGTTNAPRFDIPKFFGRK